MSHYTIYVIPDAWDAIRNLPGHVRQRVRRAIGALADDPRPHQSKELNVSGFERELRRLRFGHWRVVYAITEGDNAVDVLAVRKRPPYDYGDLGKLIEEIQRKT